MTDRNTSENQNTPISDGPICPQCGQKLDARFQMPLLYWCEPCGAWFNSELKRAGQFRPSDGDDDDLGDDLRGK